MTALLSHIMAERRKIRCACEAIREPATIAGWLLLALAAIAAFTGWRERLRSSPPSPPAAQA